MRVSAFVLMFGLGAVTLTAQQNSGNGTYTNNPSTQQQQEIRPAGVGVSNAKNEDTSGPPGDVGERMRDKYFLKRAAQGSRASVQMSQLALAKSANEDVKTFAQKIMTDHAVLVHTWKPLAQDMGAIPERGLSKKDQKLYDRLSTLSGDEFDKEYMLAMTDQQRDGLKMFKDTMNATANAPLKDALDKTIPVIQEQLAMADTVARKNGYVAMK